MRHGRVVCAARRWRDAVGLAAEAQARGRAGTVRGGVKGGGVNVFAEPQGTVAYSRLSLVGSSVLFASVIQFCSRHPSGASIYNHNLFLNLS